MCKLFKDKIKWTGKIFWFSLIASQVASHLPSSATSKNQNYPSETNIKDPSTSGNAAWFSRSQGTFIARVKESLLGVLAGGGLSLHRQSLELNSLRFNEQIMLSTNALLFIKNDGYFRHESTWFCWAVFMRMQLEGIKKKVLKIVIKIQWSRWNKIGRHFMVAEATWCFIVLFSLLLYVFEIFHNKNERFF